MKWSIIFLVAAGLLSCAHASQDCLVGNLLVLENLIVSKSVESSCSSSELEVSCFCNGDKCNKVELEENIPIGIMRSVSKIIETANQLMCYSGLHSVSPSNTISIGAQIACDGQCASFSGFVNGNITTSYKCVPNSICDSFGLHNSCQHNGTFTVCCCNNANNCNIASTGIILPPPQKTTDFPIACHSGVYVNGIAITPVTLEVCQGQCSSTSLNSSADGVVASATYYGCDATPVCQQLNMNNLCSTVSPGVQGCCCNTDVCLDPALNKTAPAVVRTCFTGVYEQGRGIGSEMICEGSCFSMSSLINDDPVTILGCIETKFCRQLELYNECNTVAADRDITSCCCDNYNNCNIDFAGLQGKINVILPASSLRDYPISCYNGLFINNAPASVIGWQSCTGIKDSCRRLYEDRAITFCCCNNVDNCNVQNTDIIPPPLTPSDDSIVCYSGLYVDGSPLSTSSDTKEVCQGRCTSIQYTSAIQGQIHIAKLYSCSPKTICEELDIKNGCYALTPGVVECCCDSDLCMDPTKNRTIPYTPQKCFSGIYAQEKSNGSEVLCDGSCASISTTVNNDPVTLFECVHPKYCQQLELDNSCETLFGDKKTCCCDNYDNCNVDLAGLTGKIDTSQPIANLSNIPISCYSGLFVNGQPMSTLGWQLCFGECASVTFTTTNFDAPMNTTSYFCDQTNCNRLGLSNTCFSIQQGLTGCCCSDNACLVPNVTPTPRLTTISTSTVSLVTSSSSPTFSPISSSTLPFASTSTLTTQPPTPAHPLNCFVGIQSTYDALSLGSQIACDGQCASFNGVVGGYNVTTYHCLSIQVCDSLKITNNCANLVGYGKLIGCCCNSSDNCNVKDPNFKPKPPVIPAVPVSCYQGLVLDGQKNYLTIQECNGYCASLTVTTSGQKQNHISTLYTCDSTSICQYLNLTNGCYTLQSGLSGCCCNTDGCLNPYTDSWPGPVNCYVGVYASDNKTNYGATVPCDGYCGSMEITIENTFYKSYHCVPRSVCKSLNLVNKKNPISTDKNVTGYCCTAGSNCHVTEPAVNTTNLISPEIAHPNLIACRSSIYLNEVAITQDSYSLCHGQCATVSYTSLFNSSKSILTLYTCDTTSVCDSFGLSNSCSEKTSGFSGCCCTTNNCVGPHVSPTPPSGSSFGISIFIVVIVNVLFFTINNSF
ncbi:hypothetical protein CRE_05073 [Caenorhabditis remanei]|uniref:Uncharacterized protein n=1 Tax=Caenorhabditis remanei TaxID=31234 RepID=E3MZ19_CAERE|nr:hypothetical protein CRE_05073 [Caenorhabditis remanei]